MKRQNTGLEPFRSRLFVAYWSTALVANFGWLIQVVGTSWLMISIGGTLEQVALIQTSMALPVMLFSLFAGAVADSRGRRVVVMAAQAFLLVTSSVLALFAYMGWVSPWMLLAFTFLIGAGKAISNPAWQTLVIEFMPREQLPAAIALNSVGFNIARSVGPMIGGVIVAAVGAFVAFAVSAVSNAGMLVVLARWKGRPEPRDLPPESIGSAMLAGIRFAAMSPHILRLLLRGASHGFGAISVLALLPLIARDLVQGGPQTYGILLGAFGMGAIAGAFFSARLRAALSLEILVRVGFIIFAFATIALGLSGNIILSAASTAIAGASWLITLSAMQANVQVSSPRWVVSRCHALFHTACFAGNALGSIVWGMWAANYDLPSAMIASAGALILGTIIGLKFTLQELDAKSLDPSERWIVPEVVLDMQPQSGPILTTIEYIITPDKERVFLAVMAERRKVRLRNGARGWALSRNIMQPEIWTERYHTPTFIETQRMHARRTIADADLTEQLLKLHSGDGRPKVQYSLDRQTGWFRTGGLQASANPDS